MISKQVYTASRKKNNKSLVNDIFLIQIREFKVMQIES